MTHPTQIARGTLALSWGKNGGFYLHRRRICLGRVALTYVPLEVDDLMRSYAAYADTYIDDSCWAGVHDACLGCGCSCHA